VSRTLVQLWPTDLYIGERTSKVETANVVGNSSQPSENAKYAFSILLNI